MFKTPLACLTEAERQEKLAAWAERARKPHLASIHRKNAAYFRDLADIMVTAQ